MLALVSAFALEAARKTKEIVSSGLVEGERKEKACRSFSFFVDQRHCLTCRAESVVIRANPGLRLKPANVYELGAVGVDQNREGDGLWCRSFFFSFDFR